VAAVPLVAYASSFLPYTRSLFAETTIAMTLAAGLWAMQADRPGLAGLCVACAAFLKPPFALVGVAWAAERLWARRPRSAVTIAAVVGAASVALMLFNWMLARRLLVGGAEVLRFGLALDPLVATLFGSKTGVLLFVPWVAIPLVAPLFMRPRTAPPATAEAALLRQIALPTALYLAVLLSLGNTPGVCYGPRYWVPVLPWLGAAAAVVASRHRALRVPLAIAALVAMAQAVPAALKYVHLF
jgi:hypothetical protein